MKLLGLLFNSLYVWQPLALKHILIMLRTEVLAFQRGTKRVFFIFVLFCVQKKTCGKQQLGLS